MNHGDLRYFEEKKKKKGEIIPAPNLTAKHVLYDNIAHFLLILRTYEMYESLYCHFMRVTVFKIINHPRGRMYANERATNSSNLNMQIFVEILENMWNVECVIMFYQNNSNSNKDFNSELFRHVEHF